MDAFPVNNRSVSADGKICSHLERRVCATSKVHLHTTEPFGQRANKKQGHTVPFTRAQPTPIVGARCPMIATSKIKNTHTHTLSSDNLNRLRRCAVLFAEEESEMRVTTEVDSKTGRRTDLQLRWLLGQVLKVLRATLGLGFGMGTCMGSEFPSCLAYFVFMGRARWTGQPSGCEVERQAWQSMRHCSMAAHPSTMYLPWPNTA